MSEELPEPPLPLDVDLRDYRYMPIEINRLLGSNFNATCDDTAWRAGVTLWLKSFYQIPSASMPDDDAWLAKAADLGRDMKTWKRIKDVALHGWRKCSDGRLYHFVIAEKALEGWLDKLVQQRLSAAGNAKRNKLPFDSSPFDVVIEDCLGRLKKLNPQSRRLHVRSLKPSSESPAGNEFNGEPPPGGSEIIITDEPGGGVLSPKKPPNRIEGNGIEGIKQENKPQQRQPYDLANAAASKNDFSEERRRCEEAAGAEYPDFQVMIDLLQEGVDLDDRVLPVIRDVVEKLRKSTGDRPQRWAYFEKAIRDKNRVIRHAPKASIPATTKTIFVVKDSDQWKAWVKHNRGKTPPTYQRPADKLEGWNFASEWPPVESGSAECAS